MPSISCVAYTRVSTEHQAGEKLTSLADQEAAIHGLATRLGAELGRWFRDAGASGATVEGRPAFRELLAWCEANRRPSADRGLVLVLNDSRFGRFPEPEEATYWRHHLYRLGWVVRFVEGDDVEGDFRTVVRAIGSVQASEYRRNLVANTRRGMAGAASQGFWTREAPYGYRRQVVYPPSAARILERGQRKVDGEKVRLVPHAEEAAHVRWAFHAYAAGGESLASIAEQLHRRDPRRKWGRTVVGTMLSNPAYRGDVVGGRRRDGGGELYGCEGAHSAIVGVDVWHAVQRRLDRNAELGSGVRNTHYLLSGLLRCAYCGETYVGGGGGRSRTRNPERSHRRFYRDTGGIRGVCPGRIGTVMRHLVDDAAVELIASTVTSTEGRRTIERALDDALERAAEGAVTPDAGLRANLRRLERRRTLLVGYLADGTLLAEEARPELEQIRAEASEAETRLQALRFAKNRARVVRSERERLLEVVLDFPAQVVRLSGLRLRRLVEPWIGEAKFDKVGRILTLGIRPAPAFAAPAWPGPDVRAEGGLIVRSTSLVQRGHEYRVAEAQEVMMRAGGAR